MNTTARLRRRLAQAFHGGLWKAPELFGPDGWKLVRLDYKQSVIVSACDFENVEWIHASIAGDAYPTYADLVRLHRAVWGTGGYAYQVFAPADEHINIHAHALHLWGRADGAIVLPNFGAMGSI